MSSSLDTPPETTSQLNIDSTETRISDWLPNSNHLVQLLFQLDFQLISFHCLFTVQYAKEYIANRIREQQNQQGNNQISNPSFYIDLVINCDQKVLTYDDQKLAFQGLSPQQYDAFLLFADEDIDFATEIIENLESNDVKVGIWSAHVINLSRFGSV